MYIPSEPVKTPDLSVENCCPLYLTRQSQWKVMRDCIEGSDAVKAAREEYLPKAPGKSKIESERRYASFLKRAVYVNFTGQALDIMHGMIFRRSPAIQAPDNFIDSGALGNIDNRGDNLYQFLSDCVRDVMATGFGGILLDMPAAPEGLTVEEAEKMGIRPHLKYYKAEDIDFWRFDNFNGVERLSLVKLRERVDRGSMFVHSYETRYRVLAINEKGEYYQTVYDPVKDANGKVVEYTETVIPITVNGNPIEYIPFVMLPFGEPEQPPLYNLAVLNIAHYQSTADFKNGVHISTLGTGWITGHEAKEDEEHKEQNESITLGDDVFLMIPEPEAKVGKIEFAGEGLVHSEKDIDKIESQMAGLFLKDIAPDKKTSETAESAYVHRAGENARLATLARNISVKVTQILQWFMEWKGYEGNISLQLNYDYETMSLDPNIINSIANISGQGKFPLYSVFWILQQQELVEPDMTYDDFIYLIDMEQLSGLTNKEIYDAFKNKRAQEHRAVKA